MIKNFNHFYNIRQFFLNDKNKNKNVIKNDFFIIRKTILNDCEYRLKKIMKILLKM